MIYLAIEHTTLYFSEIEARVTNLIFGISFYILVNYAFVMRTSKLAFSFTLPLLHFFFYPFLEAAAALAIASFDLF